MIDVQLTEVWLIVDAAPRAESNSPSLELDLPQVEHRVQPLLSAELPMGVTLKTITSQALSQLGQIPTAATLLPLTFNLPPSLKFEQGLLWQQCQDLAYWRRLVGELGAVARRSDCLVQPRYWLPIVLTAKGPLYGEVIGEVIDQALDTPANSPSYLQPFHFPDQWRQPLYGFAYQLLKAMAAGPSVYLLEFGWHDQQLGFDRLWPFPNQAALASLGVQSPDLFTCYWRCLANLAITDLLIPGQADYRLAEPV
jgi:hypothetical protein